MRSPTALLTPILLLLLACPGRRGEVADDPLIPSAEGEPIVLRRQQALMGTTFAIQIVSPDERRGVEAVEAAFREIARVEALISEWQETSDISAVNRAAGASPVVVGADLYRVVARAVELSRLTGGAFDITFASCGHLWSFRDPRIPADAEIAACLPRIGFEQIELDAQRSSIRLGAAEVRIGVGGIGKGYGVDRAAEVLEAHGVWDYIVDGGGDVRLRGRRIDRPWTVGIAHPRRPSALLGTLSVDRGAVVTSGDYERYFDRDGVRYHHILDPTTGRPARRSIAVTVLAPTATDADALATGLFVLGPEAGLACVEAMEGVDALIVGPDLTRHMTTGFAARFQPAAD